jgi:hypothetical protein
MSRRRIALLAVLSLAVAGSTSAAPVAVAQIPPLEILDFSARSLDSVGDDYTVAGGHPYDGTTSFSFPRGPGADDVDNVRNTVTNLPPGFVGNVAAVARCTGAQLATYPDPIECPAGSAVGMVELYLQGALIDVYPLYNMVPERGYPAQFAFAYTNKIVQLYPRLLPRTGRYGVSVVSPGVTRISLTGAKVTLFGTPSQRDFGGRVAGAPVGGPPVPFLSNPVDCLVAEPATNMYVDSWVHQARTLPKGAADFGFPDLTDPLWKSATDVAPPVTGCDSPALADQFDPSIDARPSPGVGTTQADAPTGFTVDLDFPQTNDPTDSS